MRHHVGDGIDLLRHRDRIVRSIQRIIRSFEFGQEVLAYKANTTLNSKIQNKLAVIVGNHNALVVCSVHKRHVDVVPVLCIFIFFNVFLLTTNYNEVNTILYYLSGMV